MFSQEKQKWSLEAMSMFLSVPSLHPSFHTHTFKNSLEMRYIVYITDQTLQGHVLMTLFFLV